MPSSVDRRSNGSLHYCSLRALACVLQPCLHSHSGSSPVTSSPAYSRPPYSPSSPEPSLVSPVPPAGGYDSCRSCCNSSVRLKLRAIYSARRSVDMQRKARSWNLNPLPLATMNVLGAQLNPALFNFAPPSMKHCGGGFGRGEGKSPCALRVEDPQVRGRPRSTAQTLQASRRLHC